MNHRPSKINAETPVRASVAGNQMINRFIRISGGSILVLLVVAYATGEEFEHTHGIIGYGIAVLLVAGVLWEFIRTRGDRFSAYGPSGTRAIFQNAINGTKQSDAPQTAAIGFLIILPILALLAASAVIIMLITHNFWGATLVDEMHEVVAYFALGLLAFHVAAVVVTSIAFWQP